MKKLTLDVDALQVESFATETAARGRGGTVHAHNHTRGNHLTCGGTCDGGNTCNCPITAEVTCLEPCGTTLCGETSTCGGEESVCICSA
jgi:hypothetical protein